MQFFEISSIWSFWNCLNWKIQRFRDFFNLENQSLAPKFGNFGIVRPFDIPHYSQFCNFSSLPFDINQFRRFIFLTFIPYSSGNFLDWQIHKIIKFLKLFNFENHQIFQIWQFVKLSKFQKFPIWTISNFQLEQFKQT